MFGERVEGDDRMSDALWQAIGLILFGERVDTAARGGMSGLSTAISPADSPSNWWAEKVPSEPLEPSGEER